ncbi:M48 family metallopeptidase [Sphingorhabdus soli]|uniref:M48 family metallopeptidase n=1 Tax=Flavisphingopyxis soli TaxID=2601267 RepID=A0A5C6URZ5_9SPHN|nr:M48 family metallopeptidase [Sphingorhabdus soli]TXC73628.1 M48 family metallopeptidase [Sphingorhabdus soli]
MIRKTTKLAAIGGAAALFALLPAIAHAAAPAHGFDVEAATRAYLDTLQGPARAQSDAYFEGGYWLILWGALVAVIVDGLLLRFRFAAKIRDVVMAKTQRLWIVTWAVALAYTIASFVLTLPWSIYTGFFRERQYDLLNQGFVAWFGEQLTSLAISLVVVPLIIVAIYAVIRRAPRSWWLWGTGLVALFAIFGAVVAPVYVSPLFNTYSEMQAGPLRDRIVAMAAANDIPSEHIYVFDASKQTKRISANVSGLGPTIRISLNDNLLNRTTPAEVAAVMGHEMGHYVLNHVWISVFFISLIFGLGLFLIARIAPRVIARHGDRWGISSIGDPASLPLLSLMLGVYFFLATPALNTLIRVDEEQADVFGLNAAREPDAFARVAMRLSEYRKIEPGRLEEFLFFDHPSGATRVRGAMEWKAKNVPNPQIVIPPPLTE